MHGWLIRSLYIIQRLSPASSLPLQKKKYKNLFQEEKQERYKNASPSVEKNQTPYPIASGSLFFYFLMKGTFNCGLSKFTKQIPPHQTMIIIYPSQLTLRGEQCKSERVTENILGHNFISRHSSAFPTCMKSISSSDGLLFEKKTVKQLRNFLLLSHTTSFSGILKTSQLLRRP